MTDTITAIKKALEGVTPGPWQVLTKEHDWAFPETAISPAASGKHVERRIFTTWVHPQLKAEWGVVDLALAVDGNGKMSLHIVGLSENDANYIAAVNPEAISELLSTLESLQRENEELRKGKDHIAAEKAGIAKNAHGNVDYWKSQYEAAEAEVKRYREALHIISAGHACPIALANNALRPAALSSTGDTHGN